MNAGDGPGDGAFEAILGDLAKISRQVRALNGKVTVMGFHLRDLDERFAGEEQISRILRRARMPDFAEPAPKGKPRRDRRGLRAVDGDR